MPEPKVATPNATDAPEVKSVLANLRNFAQQYDLKEGKCGSRWPVWSADAPCYAFMRLTDEGIGLYFFAKGSTNLWEVVLLKERRVFGRYSTSEVERDFDASIKQPLLEALGEARSVPR
jgi:hypothetical protein